MPYQPYRGPRRARKGKAVIIFSFIFLALIVSAVVYFTVQEYIVFTAEGFRFEFPWTAAVATEPPATEPPATTEPVTIVIIDTTAPPTTAPPTTVPPYEKPETAARLVTPEDFAAGADFEAAVYVKNYDGIWHIPPGTEPADGAQTQALEALASAGGAAVVSAMRDAVGPRTNRSLAVTTTGGVTWLDYDNISWFNPYAGGGGLSDAVQVCAGAGVPELIFTNLQFPTRGRLEYISYGEGDTPENRAAAIAALLEPCREYLDASESGLYLSVVLTETAAQQFVDEGAGQDVLELAKLCDILYVPTDDPDYDVNPLLDLIQGTGCRVGLWLNQAEAPERVLDIVLLK